MYQNSTDPPLALQHKHKNQVLSPGFLFAFFASGISDYLQFDYIYFFVVE
jgi:hypothetical protein